jgi:hypothetical protein
MNRRNFLAGFGQSAAAAGAGVVLAAKATGASAGAAVVDGAKRLGDQVESLSKRVDKMETSHKRLVKALIVVASVSTGFDVLNLLRGDPFS